MVTRAKKPQGKGQASVSPILYLVTHPNTQVHHQQAPRGKKDSGSLQSPWSIGSILGIWDTQWPLFNIQIGQWTTAQGSIMMDTCPPLSKPRRWATSRGNPDVNYEHWVIMMRTCRFIICIRNVPFWWGTLRGEAPWRGGVPWEISIHSL